MTIHLIGVLLESPTLYMLLWPCEHCVCGEHRAKVALLSISQMMTVTAAAVMSGNVGVLANYTLLAFTLCGLNLKLLIMFYKEGTPFGELCVLVV